MPLPVGPASGAPQGSLQEEKKGIPIPLPTSRKDFKVYDLDMPPLGHWNDRALAALIDLAILFTPLTVAILLAASSSPDVRQINLVIVVLFGVLLSGAVWAGQAWLEGSRGQTIGKKILGLVVIRRVDGLVLGFGPAARRNFIKLFLDVAPLGMGLGSIMKEDTLRQSNADTDVNSVVVYDSRRSEEGKVAA